MVMIGESARWQCGSLLENFGHRGALELTLQSLTYQSRGALHLDVLCVVGLYCPICEVKVSRIAHTFCKE